MDGLFVKNQNEKEVYFKKNENTEGVRNDEKSDVMSTEQKTKFQPKTTKICRKSLLYRLI